MDKTFKTYLRRSFTEAEVERIARHLDLYNTLFPYGVKPIRFEYLFQRAKDSNTEFARKIEAKMKTSKKYEDLFVQVYVVCGYLDAAR